MSCIAGTGVHRVAAAEQGGQGTTAEAWTVVAVGLAGLIITLHRGLDTRLRNVEQGQAEIRERMAKLEGAVEGFVAGQRYLRQPAGS